MNTKNLGTLFNFEFVRVKLDNSSSKLIQVHRVITPSYPIIHHVDFGFYFAR
jgi:hypothetical protein